MTGIPPAPLLRAALLRCSGPLRIVLAILLALLAALVPDRVRAHMPIARFERLTIAEELARAPITAILQDRIGFLWLGTAEGLYRYDGYSFTAFAHDPAEPATLPDNVIHELYEDGRGRLWVGTGRGLSRFDRDRGRFERIASNPDESRPAQDAVTGIVEDGAGSLWVSSISGTVSRIGPDGALLAAYRPTPESGVARLQVDLDGRLWAGLANGLFRFDRERDRFEPIRFAADGLSRSVSALHAGRDGRLWIGTPEGLFALDRSGRPVAHVVHDPDNPRSLSSDAVSAIVEGRDGTLWVGTHNAGLNARDPTTGAFVRHRFDAGRASSLGGDAVWALYEDRAGLIWAAGPGGTASIFNPATRVFQIYGPDPTQPLSLPHRSITALYGSADGAVWIGDSGDAGLARFDPAAGTIVGYRHNPADPTTPPGDQLLELFEDRAGVVWAGIAGHGLVALDEAGRVRAHYRHAPGNPNSLQDDHVYEVLEDRAGMLWIGTNDGMSLLNRESERFRPYYRTPGDLEALNGAQISAIHEARDGTIWIGTVQDGLFRYSPAAGRLMQYPHGAANPQSLNHSRVHAIDEGPVGHVWVATDAGLSRLDPLVGEFVHFGERDGLPAPAILCALVGPNGEVWVAARRGLARLDPLSGEVRRYGARDGLQVDYFSSACARGRDGELIFGSRGGLAVFRPEQVQPAAYAPPVVLTAIEVLNQPVALERDIATLDTFTLSHEEDVVSFTFAALDYADPLRVQYEYMLEGFDDDWVAAGPWRRATYTNLDGGNYLFRVRAAGSGGTWNEQGVRLALTVATPPWRSWWAYGFYIVASAGAVAGAAWGWAQRRANRRLAAEVRERRRVEIEQRQLYAVAAGLREVLAVINSNRPLPEVLQFIIVQACRLLDVEAGQIYRLRPPDDKTPNAPGTLRVEASEGFASASVGAVLQNLPLTLSYQAIAQRRPLTAANARPTFDRLLAQPALGAGQRELVEEVRSRFRTILAVPLVLKEEVFGTITLYDSRVREFGDEEINLALAFARQSALAIENARLRQQAAQAALREERSRLARELHDSVTQSLYSLGLLAQSWRLSAREDGQAEAERQYDQVVSITHQALKEMRLLIGQLRQPELEKEGLVGAVQRRLEAVERRVGAQIRVESEGDMDLPLPVAEQLYWIIQEALNNALKHAAATAVKICFQRIDPRNYAITVSDNGNGFEPGCVAEGFGLAGMRERAAQLGATMTICSAPRQGTVITLQGTLD